MIECYEEIPCNPCESACKFGAITVGEAITSLPILSPEKCNGCGLCVASCPGLAIFMIDDTRSDGFASVTVPFEFLPLPKKGEIVLAVDRLGDAVCQAMVERVRSIPQYNRTSLVTIEIPRQCAGTVRAIRRP